MSPVEQELGSPAKVLLSPPFLPLLPEPQPPLKHHSETRSTEFPRGGVGPHPSSFQCTLNPETSEPTDNLTEQAVEFCQRVGSKASTVSEIVGQKDEAVYQAIHEGIQRVNANAAARPYHIQKWAILERDFSISGGELGKCCVELARELRSSSQSLLA